MANQPSLGSLISNVVRDAKTLLTAQVALTRTEVQQTGQQTGQTGQHVSRPASQLETSWPL